MALSTSGRSAPATQPHQTKEEIQSEINDSRLGCGYRRLGRPRRAVRVCAPIPGGCTGTSAHGPALGIANAVFVQTNDRAGNQILAYSRSATGTLSFVHAYNTGGRGYRETGAVVDPLGSQGSLYYDPKGALLIAVNAGSGTISTFKVHGDQISNRHVLRAGDLPVSVTSHGKLVYVLDGGGRGAVRGYSEGRWGLKSLAGSERGLGLNPKATPQYLNAPGQVGFTPDGTRLIVTTKANGNDIDVFGVTASGQLSKAPVKNPSANPVPYGFVFGPGGRLVVTEAGTAALSTYDIHSNGSATHVSSVSDGKTAPCWVASVGGWYYVDNTGSADVSGYHVSGAGKVSLIAAKGGVAATTDAGPTDLAGSANDKYVYVEAGGAGAIDEFAITANGTLASLGSITGLSGTGIEGIVAS